MMHGATSTSGRLKMQQHSPAGGSDQLNVFAEYAAFNKPCSSTSPVPSKVMGHDFLGSSLDSDLDIKMMENIGVGFVNSLGDTSMDSFTDLSGILMENAFLGQPEDREDKNAAPINFLDLDVQMKSNQHYWQHSFDETEEDLSSDLGKLSASVGLKRSRTPSLDHDYTMKRPRLSPEPVAAPSVEVADDPFLVSEPSPGQSLSPAPSCSSHNSDFTEDDKKKLRREKNNLASKRSREIRKKKVTHLEGEEERLKMENHRLTQRLADLEKMVERMKGTLLKRLQDK